MYEADPEPAGDQVCLRIEHTFQQPEGGRIDVLPIPVAGSVAAATLRAGEMARERVRRQGGQRLTIVACGEELERAHAQVARCDPGEDGARQGAPRERPARRW